MSSNSNLLQILDQISAKDVFEFETSKGERYMFRLLTTAQMREMVKMIVDSPLSQIGFIKAVANIIRESAVQKVDVETFSIVDRMLFMLELRINSLSAVIKIGETEVNLKEVVAKIRDVIRTESAAFQPIDVTYNQLVARLSIPSISTEIFLNGALTQDPKKLVAETPTEIQKVLGEVFIHELAKVIEYIQVGEEQTKFQGLTVQERVAIVEKLPAGLTKTILGYVEKYKRLLDGCLQVADDAVVPMDGTLFSV